MVQVTLGNPRMQAGDWSQAAIDPDRRLRSFDLRLPIELEHQGPAEIVLNVRCAEEVTILAGHLKEIAAVMEAQGWTFDEMQRRRQAAVDTSYDSPTSPRAP